MWRFSLGLCLSMWLFQLYPTRLLADEQAIPPQKSEGLQPASEPKVGVPPGEKAKESVKTVVAELTVKGSYPESASPPGIFGELSPNLSHLLQRLESAAKDKQVSAVVLRLREPEIGRAKLAEIRRAIAKVKEANKRVIAEIQSGSTADYLIACACDEIVMPESGVLMVPGVRGEVTYYKGMLDLLGIRAEMMQVGAFKGAAEPYTRNDMSPEFRQQFESVLDDVYLQMVQTIAGSRKLEPARIRELVDVGVFTAAEAKKAGLIDTIAYEDELRDALRKRMGTVKVDFADQYGRNKVDTDFSGMMGMMKMFEMMMGVAPQSRGSSAKKIAVIHASGAIVTGAGVPSLLGGEAVGSDTITKALRDAVADKNVVAIVLRVDSPGGSALASDLIWREIQKIEKPVIASMGDIAASGGYYISMGCDRIFADAGTLTGSIGVVGGKFVLGGLYQKAGVNTEVVSRGKNSGFLSSTAPMSADEREVHLKLMREIYRQFVEKAARGRQMDVEKLEALAGGRIWSGQQAKAKGLIDEVGGLSDAIAAAKKQAGLADDEKTELLILPKPKSFLDFLLEGESAIRSPIDLAPLLPAELQNHLGELAALQKLFAEPSLLLMPYRIRLR